MRLVSCYIENFGKIKAQSFDFAAGITSFLKGNGEGKTTLAAFLKAMFYGLEGCRKNSKDFNDRQHFYPFGGGAFGGNVVFACNGKTYKIERTFDEKSETKDQCRVYCNGVLDRKFGDRIGEQIFDMDKTSFERTIFITADDIEMATTDSINSKLNRFVVGGNGDTNFTAAVKQLDDYAKQFKKSSGNDLITKESNRLHDLDAQIANAETVKSSLPKQYAQLQTYDARLAELREQLQNVQGQAAVAEQWRIYDSLCADADKAQRDSGFVLHKYPKGLCTASELATAKQMAAEYNVLQAQSQKTRLDGKQTVPDAVVQQLDAQLQDYLALERKAATLPDFLVNGSAHKPRSKKVYSWLAGVALVLLLVGGGVAFVQTLVGIVLAAVGVLGLFAVGFMYLNHKVGLTAQMPNPEQRALQRQREQLGDQMRATLARYGYTAEQGVAAAVTTLKNDRKQHLSNAALNADVSKYQTALQNFCDRYASGNADYAVVLAEIESDFNQYHQAVKDAERLRIKAEQYYRDNHLTKRPNGGDGDTTALNDAWESVTNERNQLLRVITENENEVEKLDDLLQERDAASARQKDYKATYELLQKTIKYLKTAEQNLQDQCLRPIKNQFVQYANLLEKTIGEKLVMNANFEIMYEHNGINRSSQHLSAGQKSICALCFRLALIDNMFANEKPFLILDDPFVHLDQEHLTKAKKLLREMATTKQIVYFTCHDSRDVR